MKKQAPIALLAAGKTRDSFLRRVPHITERLGPVGSTSLRLASRIVNILQAGVPVGTLEAFAQAAVILISVPDSWLEQFQDELLRCDFRWKEKTVLLFDSKMDSAALGKLADAGAAVGSITPVPLFDEKLAVVEGSRKAVQAARKLMRSPGVRVLTMDAGQKSLFTAGTGFATSLALPLLAASVETLRASGIDQNQALSLAEKLFQKTMRTYLKSGRRGWEGALSAQDRDGVRRQVQALFRESPLLAAYYYENAIKVSEILKQDPAWIREAVHEVYSTKAAGAI
ncbi:MAG: DUF2520 domain-containing protein [Bryobacterales bacterium]|nr:DUF2520 domain-containing protein [Bryobacterales bacterium]